MTSKVDPQMHTRVNLEKRERIRTYSDETNTPKQMRRCDSAASTISNMTITDENPTDLSRKSSLSSTKSTVTYQKRLEDLVTCPIHLGMMEEPRMLPCGHAFCLNCLDGYVSNRQHNITSSSSSSCNIIIDCPICRTNCEVADLEILPPSLAHKQLADYIVETQSQYYLQKYYPHLQNIDTKLFTSNSSELCNATIEQKRELIGHLIREITQTTTGDVGRRKSVDYYTEQLDIFISHLEESQSTVKIDNESNVLSGDGHINIENSIVNSSNNLEMFNSNYELLDVETIRENMKKYSEYKLQRDVNRILVVNSNNNNHDINSTKVNIDSPTKSRTKILNIDLKLVNSEPELFVWIDANMKSVFIRTHDHSDFHFEIKTPEEVVMKPFYLKLLPDNCLLISGNTRHDFGLFLYSTDGEYLRQAQFDSNLHPASAQIGGFFMDFVRNKIFVCMPNENKICVLDNYQEISQGYLFVDLHPTYVAYNRGSNEIWASCPQDGKIVITDELTGSYRQLGTDQIYNAIPSHITITIDNRVLFLDCHKNRVFWVRKRNNFILIQRITFGNWHHNKLASSDITAMTSIVNCTSQLDTKSNTNIGKLLFSTVNRAYLFKPAKSVHGSQNHKHLMCALI